MTQHRDEASAEERRSVLGCYLLLYCLIILPTLAVFALPKVMQGRSAFQVPVDLYRDLVELDPIAIVIVVATLPMFVFLGRIGPRRTKRDDSAAP